jgi:alkanesulfonate monooxygenase SsuD/methylene tetrahydromethanopterin reductase-like flavin-dependent oxidoreductase (luciferase family)
MAELRLGTVRQGSENMTKLVRLGLQIPQAGPNAAADFVKTFVRRGRDCGFRKFWVGDHILMGGFNHRAKENETFLEPLVLLAYVLGQFDDIDLGTSVLVVPYRNAFSLAKGIATLAHLSQKDIAVGIGPGWAEHEFHAVGSPFHERGALADEFCRLFMNLRTAPDEAWQVGPYSYGGSGFEPRLSARTQLWVGGNSAAARRRVVRWGDAWQPTGLGVEAMREGIADLRQLCDQSGRDFSQVATGLRLRVRPTPDAPANYVGDLLGPYVEAGVCDFLLEINTRDRQRALDSIDRLAASARLAGFFIAE